MTTGKNKHPLPKVAIIGAGSIGMLFFHKLCASGLVQPFFIDPRKTPSSKNKNFCNRYLRLMLGATSLYHLARFHTISQIEFADAVIISTKAYDTPKVCLQIKNHIPKKIPIIVAANGLGAVNEAQDILYPCNPVLGAVTANGAMKKGTTCFYRGHGPTFIGPSLTLTSQYQKTTQLLAHQRPLSSIAKAIDGKIVTNVDSYILKKLSANAVINPITAIHSCNNGELSSYLSEATQICDEICPILGCMGFKTTPDNLLRQALQICDATAKNYSSMEQDIVFNRKTEIDYIIGPLIGYAQMNGLPHSFCLSLSDKIKSMYKQE